MNSKNRKRLLLVASLFLFMLIAAGCSTAPVSSASTGFWDHYIIYNFSRFLLWLADIFGGSYGWAIVAFTIIIRLIILPLTWWQSKTMMKQQEVAPEIQALQKKYASKDVETQQKLREETQKLYAEAGVNPVIGCLPLLVQMPVLIALYQAIYRTSALKSGSFLWMQLGKADPYFIMAIFGGRLYVCHIIFNDDVTTNEECYNDRNALGNANHDFRDGDEHCVSRFNLLGSYKCLFCWSNNGDSKPIQDPSGT